MLTRLTKGQQVTIPAKYRNELEIDETTILDIELNNKEKKITIKPVKERPLKVLFAECDAIKNKTNKSIKELEEEYERENMLH